MKTSIIIPTYNRSDELDNLLKPLCSSDMTDQIIVVDDQSTDGTEEVAKRYDIEYTKSSANGQVEAKRTGIELADGEIIGFLEDDMIVTESFLDPVLGAFQDGKKIVQSKVVFQDHGLEPIDADPEPLVEYRWNFNHITKWHYGSTGQYIPFGLESGRFVHETVLEDVPIVDDNLLGDGFGESVSFCLRARQKGYEIYFEPDSLLIHVGADDGGSSERFDKNLSTSSCTEFEFYRFHNNMYIHSRFFPQYILPAMIYHLGYTTAVRVWLSKDLTCVKQIPRGLLKGVTTELRRRLSSSETWFQ